MLPRRGPESGEPRLLQGRMTSLPSSTASSSTGTETVFAVSPLAKLGVIANPASAPPSRPRARPDAPEPSRRGSGFRNAVLDVDHPAVGLLRATGHGNGRWRSVRCLNLARLSAECPRARQRAREGRTPVQFRSKQPRGAVSGASARVRDAGAATSVTRNLASAARAVSPRRTLRWRSPSTGRGSHRTDHVRGSARYSRDSARHPPRVRPVSRSRCRR